MNVMIYIFTIISAIFLPLSLMVGFFGMNTGGLSFTAGTNGSLNAVVLMSFLLIVTSVSVLLWNRKIE